MPVSPKKVGVSSKDWKTSRFLPTYKEAMATRHSKGVTHIQYNTAEYFAPTLGVIKINHAMTTLNKFLKFFFNSLKNKRKWVPFWKSNLFFTPK